MRPSPPANILILAADPAGAARWTEILAAEGHSVWPVPCDVPRETAIEVVLTDEAHLPPLDGLGADQAAVVRLGVPGPCDLLLPPDFTARELCLACRLLADNVRLRRRQEQGARRVRELEQEAAADSLTGLPNRRAWDRALSGLFDEAAAPAVCLAIVDLDHFKRVNDEHGHAAGDEVLRAAGRALRDGLRQDDFVARLGGDEFGLLLTVADHAAAMAVVDRVRRAIPAALARAGLPRVTASAGLALSSPLPSGEGPGVKTTASPLPTGEGPGVRAASPLPAADAALRQAKQAGRDRTCG